MSGSSEPAPRPPAPPSRLKRLAQNLGLSAASLLVCVGLLELVLRALGYGRLEVYEPDPRLFWRLKPNQRCYTKVGRKPVRINAQGTRGPDFQPAKPPGTLRILSLGDSKTFGWGLSEEETYSGRLQQLLQERLGTRARVEVINAGVNAWSYGQMLLYFRERALGYSPDFVLVGDANLWTQFSDRADPEFARKFQSRVRLKNLLRRFALYHFFIEVQLQDFYQRYRTRFIPVDPGQDPFFREQQQKDPDEFFRATLSELCQVARSHHVRPVLLYLPLRDELASGQPGRLLKVKQEVSARLGVPLLDFTAEFKPRAAALYLEADPVHLNAAGNELVARRLVDTLSLMIAP